MFHHVYCFEMNPTFNSLFFGVLNKSISILHINPIKIIADIIEHGITLAGGETLTMKLAERGTQRIFSTLVPSAFLILFLFLFLVHFVAMFITYPIIATAFMLYVEKKVAMKGKN